MQDISDKLEKLFHDNDRPTVNTHFEIGKHLHIDVYYYAKRFFQQSENVKQIAELSRDLILEIVADEGDLTLVGSGNYLGPYLAETIREIRKVKPLIPESSINYAIIDNSEVPLAFFYEPPVFNKNLLIILPITCTFRTFLNIRDFLTTGANKTKFEGHQILNSCLTPFLIIDERLSEYLQEEIAIESLINTEIQELYLSFGWRSVSKTFAEFKEYKTKTSFRGYYLFSKLSRFHLPEKCPHCFPEDPARAKSLFPTRLNPDTPNLIFAMPAYANNKGHICKRSISEIQFTEPYHTHLFGHLKIDNASFLHYIKRDRFYENNKKQILECFEPFLKELLKDWDINDRLMIITPRHHESSTILEDLSATEVLSNKLITILAVNPNDEFLENFITEFRHTRHVRKIIFFDYVISGGKTFKVISNYLKHAEDDFRGFDQVYTIFDRSTEYSKQEIIRKLSINSFDGYDKFITFFKLNVPLMDATNNGNPVTERNAVLVQLMNASHLDGLKMNIAKDIFRGAPKTLQQLEKEYEGKPAQVKQRYLLKLMIAHEISNWLRRFLDTNTSKQDFEKTGLFNLATLRKLLEKMTMSPALRYYSRGQGDDEQQEQIIGDLIIKTLSRPPFKFYQGISQAVFEYTNEKLWELISAIDGSIESLQQRHFKFYINRSVELNSNFIISYNFLSIVKKIFDARSAETLDDATIANLGYLKYFLLKCFKELVFKEPSRAVRLEQLINMPDLLPKPFFDNTSDINKVLHDQFYQLGRIIKSENIFLLTMLKEKFLSDIRETKVKTEIQTHGVGAFIREKYFSASARSSATVRLAHEFLLRSKHNQGINAPLGIPDEIYRSLESMFKLIFLSKNISHKKYIESIREILDAACSIIGEGLDYSFFIEYKNREAESTEITTKNIITILAEKNQRSLIQPELEKDGLIYNMLYGLSDQPGDKGNLQTFIPIIHDEENNVHSFKEQYFWQRNVEGEMEYGPISINAIKKDYARGNAGLKMIEESKMILLLRIADIQFEDKSSSPSFKGQAVLAICKKDVNNINSKSVIDFMNVEKVRLLLLVKADLLAFLKNYFDNDVFIDLMSQINTEEFGNSMEHGLKGYFRALRYLTMKETLTANEQRMAILVQDILFTHISTANKQNQLILDTHDLVEKTEQDLIDLFNLVMEIPGLARSSILPDERHLKINAPRFKCHRIIFNQVIPEILINMRKYALESDTVIKQFEITLNDNILSFANSFNYEENPKPRLVKQGGGKDMCNKILEKFDLEPLEGIIVDGNEMFETKLMLHKIIQHETADH